MLVAGVIFCVFVAAWGGLVRGGRRRLARARQGLDEAQGRKRVGL